MKKLLFFFITIYSIILADTQVYIETDRLLLRSWEENDFKKLCDIMQNTDVNQYVTLHNAHHPDKIKQLIENASQSLTKNGYGYFACQEKRSESLIGYVGLNYINIKHKPFPCFTISWIFNNKYWHKGYATEAGQALINYAFNIHHIKELFACTATHNKASIAVMKRLNMQFVSYFNFPGIELNEPHCQHVLYKISQND